jgi:hypothetical protein
MTEAGLPIVDLVDDFRRSLRAQRKAQRRSSPTPTPPSASPPGAKSTGCRLRRERWSGATSRRSSSTRSSGTPRRRPPAGIATANSSGAGWSPRASGPRRRWRACHRRPSPSGLSPCTSETSCGPSCASRGAGVRGAARPHDSALVHLYRRAAGRDGRHAPRLAGPRRAGRARGR